MIGDQSRRFITNKAPASGAFEFSTGQYAVTILHLFPISNHFQGEYFRRYSAHEKLDTSFVFDISTT